MNGSKKYSFASGDLIKWLKNALIFASPVAVIYLLFVSGNIEKGGFQMNDFIPNEVVIGAMVLYVINVGLDFFRKYISDTRK